MRLDNVDVTLRLFRLGVPLVILNHRLRVADGQLVFWTPQHRRRRHQDTQAIKSSYYRKYDIGLLSGFIVRSQKYLSAKRATPPPRERIKLLHDRDSHKLTPAQHSPTQMPFTSSGTFIDMTSSMADTPSPHPDLNRNRLPTLFEVLSRQTLAPVDLFSFYIYMRDQQRSVDYLDFW